MLALTVVVLTFAPFVPFACFMDAETMSPMTYTFPKCPAAVVGDYSFTSGHKDRDAALQSQNSGQNSEAPEELLKTKVASRKGLFSILSVCPVCL